MNRRTIVTLVAALALSAQTALAAAPRPAPGGGAGFSFSDWHVTTGQLDANWQTGNFNTPGRIVLTRPGSDIASRSCERELQVESGDAHRQRGAARQQRRIDALRRAERGQRACDTDVQQSATSTANRRRTLRPATCTSQGGSQVRADRAVMNGLTHDIHLYGNVQLQQ